MSRCGTTSGHAAHQRAGEKPCDACARAKRKYDKRRLSADDLTIKNRLRARAQWRARKRLMDDSPDVYRQYYREELERIYAEEGITR